MVDALKDQHKIAIRFDKKAMDDANIAADVPVTIGGVKGVSLRSALRRHAARRGPRLPGRA